jgi:hypothetical protein
MSLAVTARTTSRGAGLVRGDALRVPLRDGSVHLGITSPPYFALRSYQDDGEHYAGQIGSESNPVDFLLALWAVADEMHRVLADGGSMWWNLGDKYAGSGGHNNANLAPPHTGEFGTRRHNAEAPRATRRSAPDRYNQTADVRAKSLMGLPWRFAMGLICPDIYRAPLEPAACWHDDGPGPCRTCPPRRFPQWIGRAEVIWSKPNGLPESVTDRVRRSHEQWFHVTKAPQYFAGIDEIREAQATAGERHDGRSGGRDGNRMNGGRDFNERALNPLGKLPGSVWTVPSEPLAVPAHLGVDHFAAFPQEWPRRIILGWSPMGICTACDEGRRPVVEKELGHVNNTTHAKTLRSGGEARTGSAGNVSRETATIIGYACACPTPAAPTRPAVVLDPFSGTGTVAMVARTLGRYGVGVDLSRDYLRLANWRVFQSGHARKTEARTNRERQGDLFGGAA